MTALCACSALIGFRMGAPADTGTFGADQITATTLPALKVRPDTARSGPEWHAPTVETTGAASPAAWTASHQNQNEAARPETIRDAPVSTSPVITSAKRARVERHPPRAPAQVLVPMVFRDVDPVSLGLSAAQWQEIDRMRASFSEKVGQPEPANPAYRQRWVSAQPESDEQLRSFLGWDKFNQYQIAAAQAR